MGEEISSMQLRGMTPFYAPSVPFHHLSTHYGTCHSPVLPNSALPIGTGNQWHTAKAAAGHLGTAEEGTAQPLAMAGLQAVAWSYQCKVKCKCDRVAYAGISAVTEECDMSSHMLFRK